MACTPPLATTRRKADSRLACGVISVLSNRQRTTVAAQKTRGNVIRMPLRPGLTPRCRRRRHSGTIGRMEMTEFVKSDGSARCAAGPACTPVTPSRTRPRGGVPYLIITMTVVMFCLPQALLAHYQMQGSVLDVVVH